MFFIVGMFHDYKNMFFYFWSGSWKLFVVVYWYPFRLDESYPGHIATTKGYLSCKGLTGISYDLLRASLNSLLVVNSREDQRTSRRLEASIIVVVWSASCNPNNISKCFYMQSTLFARLSFCFPCEFTTSALILFRSLIQIGYWVFFFN